MNKKEEFIWKQNIKSTDATSLKRKWNHSPWTEILESAPPATNYF